jgi:leader peptidase (prepilin peptidase) / N-methyltransferase
MIALEQDLRPNLAILAVGCGAIAVVSATFLPWPIAVASMVLGALMVAGAEVDARTCLLPDVVTYGATVAGVFAAAALKQTEPWHAMCGAVVRAIAVAFVLATLRFCYERLRGREGLGLGDVKLAAAVGAWLPVEAIPLCFGLAAGGALVTVMVARARGQSIDASIEIPFGAFLCPALWLVFYAGVLPG